MSLLPPNRKYTFDELRAMDATAMPTQTPYLVVDSRVDTQLNPFSNNISYNSAPMLEPFTENKYSYDVRQREGYNYWKVDVSRRDVPTGREYIALSPSGINTGALKIPISAYMPPFKPGFIMNGQS